MHVKPWIAAFFFPGVIHIRLRTLQVRSEERNAGFALVFALFLHSGTRNQQIEPLHIFIGFVSKKNANLAFRCKKPTYSISNEERRGKLLRASKVEKLNEKAGLSHRSAGDMAWKELKTHRNESSGEVSHTKRLWGIV